MQTIIVADDMTGANVSNSLLAKDGYKVMTINDTEHLENFSDVNFDALGVHTDSRGMTGEEAYQAVYETMQTLKELDVRFFNKRIDSTLRGNCGAELDAMLDVLGDDYIALVVAAYPDSDKVIVGNYMLVDGVPLEKTDVANDPTAPVHSSKVNHAFTKQTKKEVGVITVETILQGKEAIKDNILALKGNGAQIIIFDTFTNEDIETIAQATLELDLKFVSVDPGPFTYYLVKNHSQPQTSKVKQKLLFVIGSVSGIAVSQIDRFKTELQPYVCKIDARRLVLPETREVEIQRVVETVERESEDDMMILVATMINKSDKLDLNLLAEEYGISVSQVSHLISTGVAEIGHRLAREMGEELGGVYTSGGDITRAFLEATQTTGIEIKDEVIPLAVYGTIVGGELDDKEIITKGGLIGDEYTLYDCATFLATKISDKYYVKGAD